MSVVAIDEQSKEALNAIRHATGGYNSPHGTQLSVKEVLLSEDTSEGEICAKIFSDKTFVPTIMIDASLKPQINGSRITSASIKNLAREMGIPTVSTTYSLGSDITYWRNLNDAEKQYLIHVGQPGDVIPLMVKDLALHYGYNTIVIIHDNSFGMTTNAKQI